LTSTTIGNSSWEWIPNTFADFIEELESIIAHCKESAHLVLYRGHQDRKWLLDSTFARSCKSKIFGIDPWQKLKFKDFRMSTKHQQIVLNLFFFKFDFVARPSAELFSVGEKTGIDPWFEFMKRLQQYPEEDPTYFKGTFLIDWTQKMDVALYFANESRKGEGALWICDATATGKTLQVLPVENIMRRMAELGERDTPLGVPLIFHPKRQIEGSKPECNLHGAMDLRVDLSEVWNNLHEQNDNGEVIFYKLILPTATTAECHEYLMNKGITEPFLFPE